MTKKRVLSIKTRMRKNGRTVVTAKAAKSIDLRDVICPNTSGEHMPDWSAITPADNMPGVIDVPCISCGRSGSVRVDGNDIQW